MEKVQEFGLYANLLGSYPRLGIKVNCYLVYSQTLRQLAGEIGWFPLGIDSWKFDLTGEEGFISAEGMWFKVLLR